MKKKKPAAKQATTKKPAAKSAAAKKPAAPKKAAPSPAPADVEAPRRGIYTPRAVPGIGWAPFRYPPS